VFAREAAAIAPAGAPLQLPVFDELNNLEADSASQRDLWLHGLKLLVAEQADASKQQR